MTTMTMMMIMEGRSKMHRPRPDLRFFYLLYESDASGQSEVHLVRFPPETKPGL